MRYRHVPRCIINSCEGWTLARGHHGNIQNVERTQHLLYSGRSWYYICLLYTSDAADE